MSLSRSDHHRFGERLEPRLGVAIGRRRVAVDRSEVALAVDQGVAHVEVLRETDERVVGRDVAVRVVVADDFADDLRALAVGAVRRQAHLPHRVQHAAMRRLEAVADVGQRAPDDHAHRVIEVRAPHLVFDVDGDSLFGGHSGISASGVRRRVSPAQSPRRGGWWDPPSTTGQISRLRTSSAWSSMNLRRGSTWSPISVVNIWSASV